MRCAIAEICQGKPVESMPTTCKRVNTPTRLMNFTIFSQFAHALPGLKIKFSFKFKTKYIGLLLSSVCRYSPLYCLSSLLYNFKLNHFYFSSVLFLCSRYLCINGCSLPLSVALQCFATLLSVQDTPHPFLQSTTLYRLPLSKRFLKIPRGQLLAKLLKKITKLIISFSPSSFWALFFYLYRSI